MNASNRAASPRALAGGSKMIVCTVMLLVLVWPCAGSGQPPSTTAPVETTSVDRAALTARLEAVFDRQELDEATRGRLTQLYQQARDNLRATEEWQAKRITMTTRGEGAPGAVLLDRDDPGRVLGQTRRWPPSPEEPCERTGDAPNVVFACGGFARDDELWMYYGASDYSVCLTRAHVPEALYLIETA